MFWHLNNATIPEYDEYVQTICESKQNKWGLRLLKCHSSEQWCCGNKIRKSVALCKFWMQQYPVAWKWSMFYRGMLCSHSIFFHKDRSTVDLAIKISTTITRRVNIQYKQFRDEYRHATLHNFWTNDSPLCCSVLCYF